MLAADSAVVPSGIASASRPRAREYTEAFSFHRERSAVKFSCLPLNSSARSPDCFNQKRLKIKDRSVQVHSATGFPLSSGIRNGPSPPLANMLLYLPNKL